MRQRAKQVAGPLGLGVAACAVCCVGPVVGVIGGLCLAASAVALGLGATIIAVALVVLAVVGGVARRRRRRRAGGCAPETMFDEPVADAGRAHVPASIVS